MFNGVVLFQAISRGSFAGNYVYYQEHKDITIVIYDFLLTRRTVIL